MPFISYRLLKMLYYNIIIEKNKKTDMILIKNPEGHEALCAVYSRSCIKYIKRNLLKGIFRITDILPYIHTRLVKPDELKILKIDSLNFFNINTSAEYDSFRSRWNAVKYKNNEICSSEFIKKWDSLFFR